MAQRPYVHHRCRQQHWCGDSLGAGARARVGLFGRKCDALERTAARIAGRIGAVTTVDVTEPEAITNGIGEVIETAGPSGRRRSPGSVGSIRANEGRLPPARRTFGGVESRACRSFKPQSIALRAVPGARATALTPPYPAVCASVAASKRHARRHIRSLPHHLTITFLNCQGSSASMSSGKSTPRSTKGVQSVYWPITGPR